MMHGAYNLKKKSKPICIFFTWFPRISSPSTNAFTTDLYFITRGWNEIQLRIVKWLEFLWNDDDLGDRHLLSIFFISFFVFISFYLPILGVQVNVAPDHNDTHNTL